ncbi:hypothetical protein Psch_02057 [Pelotomaculum schinkii]|uniref:CobQ/CobB/MinD/ParA nucleotide binding domain protein n=1 Tax=Pelotomaculum schinkii TaxID=78350 RepID=A0A4Y7RHN2_9FIRM|nr:hypothetical protein Psch_02057 [Pelotomaculum schinkii]
MILFFFYGYFSLKKGVLSIINKDRIVEAYIGEYAAGKSEAALSRALELAGLGRKVTLVDLDLVEPCYTLRPVQKELMARGVEVIAWEAKETLGLGEAGVTIKPAARWALRRPGDIILDIGYGVEGSKTLKLLEGAAEDPFLNIICVVNTSRPMTSGMEQIVEHVREMGKVDGLINNTHLGDETTVEVVQEGAGLITRAAKTLGLPVVATTAPALIAGQIGSMDCLGNPVRPLAGLMSKAFW